MIGRRRKGPRWAHTASATGWGESTFAEIAWDKSRGAATRWAVAGWAKTWANETAQYGITVNNVLPGYTLTGRLTEIIEKRAAASRLSQEAVEQQFKSHVPARRFAAPAEVAAAVAFLASPAAAYINGINLPVDGGRTRSL